VFFFIARQIIAKNIFPKLTQALGGEILLVIINKSFVLALVAMILGFIAYVLRFFVAPPSPRPAVNILSLQQAWSGVRAPDVTAIARDKDMAHRALNSLRATARFWHDATDSERAVVHEECWSSYRQWFTALDDSTLEFSDGKTAKQHLNGLLRTTYNEMKSYGR